MIAIICSSTGSIMKACIVRVYFSLIFHIRLSSTICFLSMIGVECFTLGTLLLWWEAIIQGYTVCSSVMQPLSI